jgi:SAM-dependent methyltransferase
MDPASYVGVDIEAGPGVDQICDATGLTEQFGHNSADLVIATELLEHVRDWRGTVRAMKDVVAPGGVLLVTTRSKGFNLHAYPSDFWRYELHDMRAIFAEFDIATLESDPAKPGVFLKARKLENAHRVELSSIELYSVVAGRRSIDVTDMDIVRFRLAFRAHRAYRRILPERVRKVLRGFLHHHALVRRWRERG